MVIKENEVKDIMTKTTRDLGGYKDEEIRDADHYAGCI